MLPLPPFTLHEPDTLAEARALVAGLGAEARLVAGGTDLLPNMKQGLVAPRHLVSLRCVRELDRVERGGGVVRLGAMTPLEVVATDPDVCASARALAEAARAVGGPHHRRMGTLGGNLCLETRCRFYNQTAFWRGALGHCLKKDGSVCHVVEKGQRCVAAASNDTAAAVIALGGTLDIIGPDGPRAVRASDFYTADGLHNTTLRAGEIVIAATIPIPPGRTSAYEKLRRRGAIDFPLLSVAACASWDGSRVASLTLVVSALAARPRTIARADVLARGATPSDALVAEIAALARAECAPLANLDGDLAWRKEMVAVLVRRALARAGLAR